MASVDAAEVLEAAEGLLDEVTVAITFPVVADGACGGANWDEGNGASVAERAPTLVRIVAFVGSGRPSPH